MGNKVGMADVWSRVQQTFVGIAIYLIIDNVILPIRTFHVIKDSVLRSVDVTRVMYIESVAAIHQLVMLEQSKTLHTAGLEYNMCLIAWL
jgi:hypothetical protein